MEAKGYGEWGAMEREGVSKNGESMNRGWDVFAMGRLQGGG